MRSHLQLAPQGKAVLLLLSVIALQAAFYNALNCVQKFANKYLQQGHVGGGQMGAGSLDMAKLPKATQHVDKQGAGLGITAAYGLGDLGQHLNLIPARGTNNANKAVHLYRRPPVRLSKTQPGRPAQLGKAQRLACQPVKHLFRHWLQPGHRSIAGPLGYQCVKFINRASCHSLSVKPKADKCRYMPADWQRLRAAQYNASLWCSFPAHDRCQTGSSNPGEHHFRQ